ncbi:MAG TPA: sulfite exporter TauE/SafE family protein [Verrucomicrobiota bacterium]|nr:sulfite exporter TauE/SafE family protein [Verrucomicrobiota bacterium]
MELWTAFLLGLVGSLHCAGMCGPLALALPSPGSGGAHVLGRVAYNLGRVATYGLIGVVFGLFGRALLLAGLQRWLSIALGVALLGGLLTSRHLAWWRPVTSIVQRLKSAMSALLRRRSLSSLALLGLLNGLLPCGLVYVAAAAAATTGGPGAAAVYMTAFGAGTIPLMLGIGLSGKVIPPAVRLKLARAMPATVFVLGVLLIVRGLSLGIPYLSPDLTAASCCH